jgi:hypothetical protein
MMTWRALAVLMVILVSVITFATIGMSRVCSNVYLRTEQYTESSSNKETNNPNSTRDSPLSDRKRTIKQILTDYNKHSLDQLQRLISRNATSRDAEVISLVRDLMDPPSNHMVKNVRHIVSTPQSKEVLTLLDNKVSVCSTILNLAFSFVDVLLPNAVFCHNCIQFFLNFLKAKYCARKLLAMDSIFLPNTKINLKKFKTSK